MWEKEKMLVTSISPFPKLFSNQLKTSFIILTTIVLSSANASNLDLSKIFSVLILHQTFPQLSTTLRKKALENTVGKGENAGNQHFLLFPQCFLTNQREKSSFEEHVCFLQIWTRLELTLYQTTTFWV